MDDANPSLLNYFNVPADLSVDHTAICGQSDAKPKPITTWSHVFSRAWRLLRSLRCLYMLSLAIALVWFYDSQMEPTRLI